MKHLKQDALTQESINERNIALLRENFPGVIEENIDGSFTVNANKLQMLIDPKNATIEENGYELNWVGKKEAYHTAFSKNTKILKPLKDDSKDFDTTGNILIKGDNLDALKILKNNYFEAIKMIYIDPPYNTKSENFVYRDNFTKSLEETMEELGYDAENIDYIKNIQGARTHSGWLSFMYPRLLLARDLLKDEGVIFVSIDDNEQANLKLLCDEIFGEENFLGNIARATGQTTGQDSGGLGSSFDFILVYGKSASLSLSGLPLTPKDIKRFDNEDEKGLYAYDQMRKTGSNDRREDRPNMFYSILAPDDTEVYPIAPAGYESCWRFERKTYERLVKEDYILWKKSKRGEQEVWWPYVKYYLEGRTKRPSPLWNDLDGNKKAARDLRDLFDGKKIFDFPKPIALLERCIQIVPNSGKEDIILDFFAGSGTTAQAVMRLNANDQGKRKSISIQLPEIISNEKTKEAYDFVRNILKKEATIFEITAERLRRAGEKIKADNEGTESLDVGFRVFEVIEDEKQSIYKKSLEEVSQADLTLLTMPQMEDIDTVLYNLLVAEALPLSSQINCLKENAFYIADNVAFIVGDIKLDEVSKLIAEHKNIEYITIYSPLVNDNEFSLEVGNELTRLGFSNDKLRFRG